MKDGKYEVIELFVYILIVITGIIMLLFGGGKPAGASGTEPPPAQTSIQSVERGDPLAVLSDEQG